MKTIRVNETVITANDLHKFLEIATFAGIDKCLIHTEEDGWFCLLQTLEAIEGNIDITNFDEDILINFFENHLFADVFHGS